MRSHKQPAKRSKIKIGWTLCAAAVMSGCQAECTIPSKSPVPCSPSGSEFVRISGSLRYSASIVPFAQAALSFKSSG